MAFKFKNLATLEIEARTIFKQSLLYPLSLIFGVIALAYTGLRRFALIVRIKLCLSWSFKSLFYDILMSVLASA